MYTCTHKREKARNCVIFSCVHEKNRMYTHIHNVHTEKRKKDVPCVHCVHLCTSKKTYVHTQKARNCVVFNLLCTLCTYFLLYREHKKAPTISDRGIWMGDAYFLRVGKWYTNLFGRLCVTVISDTFLTLTRENDTIKHDKRQKVRCKK